MMKKQLIHTEYMCILNLIALPFLVMLYHRGSMMMWALLIFLDAAKLMLKVAEAHVYVLLRDPQLKMETARIKIYLAAILLFYLCLPFVSDFRLLAIVLANDMLSALLSFVFTRYIYHDEM